MEKRTKSLKRLLGKNEKGLSITRSRKALSLILNGKQGTLKDIQNSYKQRIVKEFFVGITSRDVKAVLGEFEYSLDIVHRKEAAQILIAYFNWCWKYGIKITIDNKSINKYAIKFSQIAFARLACIPSNSKSFLSNEVIPKWVAPNVAFGWNNLGNRPRKVTFMRDIAIAACVEKFRREGDNLTLAKKRTAQKFNRKLSTVEKALVWDEGRKIAFGRRFKKFTLEELNMIVRDELEATP